MINDSQLEALLGIMHSLSVKANEASDLREKNVKLEAKVSGLQYDNERLQEQIERWSYNHQKETDLLKKKPSTKNKKKTKK